MKHLKNQLIRISQPRAWIAAGLMRIVLIVTLASAFACASVPHTGRRQFNFVSDNRLNAIALKAFREIVENEPESKNKNLNSVTERVARRVIQAAEKIDGPGYDWKIRVIEKDKPNAFCLPGGKIVVFTGILPYAENEAGLAAVVAHEVAHAVAKHHGERMSQQLALRGALGIGGEILRKEDGQLDRKSKLLLGVLGMGATVGVILPYSRTHEFEADKIGQMYMALAGYDPEESVRLWDRMSKIKKPPIPEWLSTHPATPERVRKLRESLPDAKKFYQEAPRKYGRGKRL